MLLVLGIVDFRVFWELSIIEVILEGIEGSYLRGCVIYY